MLDRLSYGLMVRSCNLQHRKGRQRTPQSEAGAFLLKLEASKGHGALPFGRNIVIEQKCVVGVDDIPGASGDLVFQLFRRPASIAENEKAFLWALT